MTPGFTSAQIVSCELDTASTSNVTERPDLLTHPDGHAPGCSRRARSAPGWPSLERQDITVTETILKGPGE